MDLLSDAIMPFGDHLEELRKRLIYSLVGLLPLLVVSVALSRRLLGFVIEPVEQALLNADLNAQLIQTSPVETFMTALKLAVVVTILVGSPWVLFQGWLFIAPGLYNNERRFVYVLLPLSAALTTLAVVFLYKVLLPVVLAFFISFGMSIEGQPQPTIPMPEGVVLPEVPMLEGDPEDIEPGRMWYNSARKEMRMSIPSEIAGEVEILSTPMTQASGILQQYRVTEYTSLFLSLALAFSLGFQTPVVVLLLGWTGIINPRDLLKFRRHVGLTCLVAGAFLTPADPLSMLLLAVPLYVLFEFGVVLHTLLPAERVSRGFGKKSPTRNSGEGPDAGDE
ncbi:MAG: twin-arginine translocase subunit TatC [Planctomycetota bacterium]|nr:twin-arginine translocase subunit TatC [Planctomycetota bacterium]